MNDFITQLIALIDKRIRRALADHRTPTNRIDGQLPPGALPPGGNTGNGYTPAPHTHDDRYYTKPESDQRFAPIDHDHDSLPSTGGTIDGDLHVTGAISALGNISGNAISGTTVAATVGIFVAPSGTAIGGINVDGAVYGTNISTTPTAGAIPKARADGTLDPGWVSGSGGGGTLPSAHASTHAAAGTDPISPASIGAATPAEVTSAVATHAAIIGSTSQAGHLKIDGASIVDAGSGTIKVQQSVLIPLVSPGTAAARTWTNQPAILTELFGVSQHRATLDLRGYTQAQIQLRSGSIAATNATIRAEYSPDNGTTWYYLDGSTGPSVLISPSIDLRAGSWSTIAAGARTAATLIRLVGVDGDGVADPTIGQIYLALR